MIKKTKQLVRALKVIMVVLRYRLDNLLLQTPLPLWVKIVLRMAPWRLIPAVKPRATRIRLALQQLGPMWIKLGQMLSTRPDIIPADIATELTILQDNVPGFSAKKARDVIERCLQKPIDQLFSHFSMTHLAAASLAQVHAVQLPDGTDAVVKVLRPGIATLIEQDLLLLDAVVSLCNRYWKFARHFDLTSVLADYKKTIETELDLRKEAFYTQRLKTCFNQSESLYVPKVYSEYSHQSIMVSERIDAISVTDTAKLLQQGTDMKCLAERGVDIFFTQVFEHNFFHADMHPGNVFVSKKHPHNPQYIALDCAIMGTLDEENQRYLAFSLFALMNQDYRQLAQRHINEGYVPNTTDVYELEWAFKQLCEPIFSQPLAKISFGNVLMQFFATARQFNMKIKPQLVLLEKTLINIEGLGQQLYPQLDVWSIARPLLERWLKRRLGIQGFWTGVKEQTPYWIEQMPYLPSIIQRSLSQFKKLRYEQTEMQQRLVNIDKQLTALSIRWYGSMVFLIILVSFVLQKSLIGQ